ncbi:hypothetical protein E4U30_000452, partial [Claviceps sp. LM220 group G6]
MHENEGNELERRLLELRETKKMLLQQIQEMDQQAQERRQLIQERHQQIQIMNQQLQERDQQIQDYYRSKQSTTFCEYIEA